MSFELLGEKWETPLPIMTPVRTEKFCRFASRKYTRTYKLYVPYKEIAIAIYILKYISSHPLLSKHTMYE
jgi:hypothetical protein